MGRLKRDHNGYHTSGLWLKYQNPTTDEDLPRAKSKKDTKRWCKGKVGVKHSPVRRFKHYSWSSRRSRVVYTICTVCGKNTGSNKAKGVPLILELDESNHGIEYAIGVNTRSS